MFYITDLLFTQNEKNIWKYDYLSPNKLSFMLKLSQMLLIVQSNKHDIQNCKAC